MKPAASISLDLDNLWSYLKTQGAPGWESYPSYLDQVVPRETAGGDRRSHPVADLGGDHHLVAFALQRLAQHHLRFGAAVDVCGVKEVDPRLYGRVDHGGRLVLADLHAEIVAAQSHLRNLEATVAQPPNLHRVLPKYQRRDSRRRFHFGQPPGRAPLLQILLTLLTHSLILLAISKVPSA